MAKIKVKRKKKPEMCDPGMCEHCVYICEGDFLCEKYAEPVIVVSDWEPTDDYLKCRQVPGC